MIDINTKINLFRYSNVNLVKNLASSSNDYDALVIVASELDQIKEHVDSSVTKDLQAFNQVRILLQNLLLIFIRFQLNKKFDKEITLTINDTVPGKRLVSIELHKNV